MRKRRESSEIIESILQATANDWVSKNKAYFAASTSSKEFNKYYEAMIKVGLLENKDYEAMIKVGLLENKEESANNTLYLCRATKCGLEFLPVLQKKSLVMKKLKKYL